MNIFCLGCVACIIFVVFGKVWVSPLCQLEFIFAIGETWYLSKWETGNFFCTFPGVQTYWIATNAQTYRGSVTVYCSDFTETSVTVMNVYRIRMHSNRVRTEGSLFRGVFVQEGLHPGGFLSGSSPSRGVPYQTESDIIPSPLWTFI